MRSFVHKYGDATGKLETRYVGAEKRAFRAHFGYVIKQVGMSQRPPATCLERFEKEDVL